MTTGCGSLLINDELVEKSGGRGTGAIDPPFNNSVTLLTGAVTIASGGSGNGVFEAASATRSTNAIYTVCATANLALPSSNRAVLVNALLFSDNILQFINTTARI